MNNVIEKPENSRLPQAPTNIEETDIGLNSLLRLLMKAIHVHGLELESIALRSNIY